MKTITTNLVTEAVYSEDATKRYLLRKTWNEKKPNLAIVMLAPSDAGAIELDTTTQLVLNNTFRLGYGSVSILNLFATLNDAELKMAEGEDVENLDAIVSAAEKADVIIYAAGVGKSKHKMFQRRQEQVISALVPFVGKLRCLCNADGEARFQHPLSPAVRTWHLSEFQIKELIPPPADSQPEHKKKSKSKENPKKE